MRAAALRGPSRASRARAQNTHGCDSTPCGGRLRTLTPPGSSGLELVVSCDASTAEKQRRHLRLHATGLAVCRGCEWPNLVHGRCGCCMAGSAIGCACANAGGSSRHAVCFARMLDAHSRQSVLLL